MEHGQDSMGEAKRKTAGVLVLSNLGPSDTMFNSDKGSWNVTRAMRDCEAGKHKGYVLDIAGALQANGNIEIDQAKVDSMVADPERLYAAPAAIGVMGAGMLWLIDGHHRVRALAELGHAEFACYVIDEADAGPYLVRFNGNPVAPWYRK